MKTKFNSVLTALLVAPLFLFACASPHSKHGDPLPSWNDGATKKSITSFVERATDMGSVDYIAPGDRLATFDNDGTLWAEKPLYVELFFTFDRVKALAPQHPEWKEKEPFKSILDNDMKGVEAAGEKGLFEALMATHTGMSSDAFEQIVKEWIATAKNPEKHRLFTEMVYQPMLELLAYLRENGFKTFIVSGGGVEFMRPWTNRVYGIPTEQVIGSSAKLKWEMRDGKANLFKLAEVGLIDDKDGKPVGIQENIGRRPVFAFGNSDGDIEMLQYTTTGSGPRFGGLVHHTDAEREWAYDRKSFVGRLDKGLDDAPKAGWTVVDMKNDWKVIFPPASK